MLSRLLLACSFFVRSASLRACLRQSGRIFFLTPFPGLTALGSIILPLRGLVTSDFWVCVFRPCLFSSDCVYFLLLDLILMRCPFAIEKRKVKRGRKMFDKAKDVGRERTPARRAELLSPPR